MKAHPRRFALVLAAAAGLAALWPSEKAPLAAPVPPLAFPGVTVVSRQLPDAPSIAGSQEPSEGDAQGLAGMRAFKDPRTGKLRQPEHEEVRALERRAARMRPDRRARAMSAQAGQTIELPGGGVALLLDDSHMVSTVATIGPDGSVVITHGDPASVASSQGSGRGRRPQEGRHDR